MTTQSFFLTFLNLFVAHSAHYQGALAQQAPLHIGGLFPFGGFTEGEESMKGDLIQPAINMALKDIESNAILPRYQIQFHVNDTQVRESRLDVIFYFRKSDFYEEQICCVHSKNVPCKQHRKSRSVPFSIF